ncbi:MAG: ArsR/SmtB family transcription factor [Candidatus Asgardarchaeia archaeon]
MITDPIKRRILLILRSGEKTARQITEELNEWFADKEKFTVQKVNYHLKQLEKAGLIEVSKEEKLADKPHITMKYYRRHAPIYLIRFSPDTIKYVQPSTKMNPKEFCRILSAFGYNLNEDDCKKILELTGKLNQIQHEELLKLSQMQKKPTGADPNVLAKFFKIMSYIRMLTREDTIKVLREIYKLLGEQSII